MMIEALELTACMVAFLAFLAFVFGTIIYNYVQKTRRPPSAQQALRDIETIGAEPLIVPLKPAPTAAMLSRNPLIFLRGSPPKADILRGSWNVRFGPIADIDERTPSPSLLRGTRRRNVRLAEIGKIRAHQPHIGRHPIAEGRVRGQRENHVHRVVAEAAAVESGKAE